MRGALAGERVALRARIDEAYRSAAFEVREFVRPRSWLFGEHRAEAADEEFLIDLLDEAIGRATEQTRVALATVGQPPAWAAPPPPGLVEAFGRASDRAIERFRAYARGVLEGGAVAEFFRQDLPRIRLDLAAIRGALARRAPDPEEALFDALDREVRRAAARRRAAISNAPRRRPRSARWSAANGSIGPLEELARAVERRWPNDAARSALTARGRDCPRRRTREPNLVLGIDEAGRGPALGAMVLAAVALEPAASRRLSRAGVADSKSFGAGPDAHAGAPRALRDHRRVGGFIAIDVCDVEIIDAYVARGALNVLERERAAADHPRARPSASASSPTGAGCSGRCARVPAPRGDRSRREHHVAVAAASICAKVRRDELFACIAARYAHEFGPVGGGGYANAATRAFTRAYVRQYGRLPPEARQSWPWPRHGTIEGHRVGRRATRRRGGEAAQPRDEDEDSDQRRWQRGQKNVERARRRGGGSARRSAGQGRPSRP